jgi:CHRD domain
LIALDSTFFGEPTPQIVRKQWLRREGGMNGKLTKLFLAGGIVALSGSLAHGQDFSARLTGFEEIGGLGAGETGAILSDGKGTLSLDVDKKPQQITYRLTYSGLSAAVTQAHIHFGKLHVAGGIMAWLCQSATNQSPTAGTPTCPATGGTVTGTLTAASIIGPTAQNVTAGDFDAITDALNSNTAYANVHTVKFPAGEIRGQVRRGDRENE